MFDLLSITPDTFASVCVALLFAAAGKENIRRNFALLIPAHRHGAIIHRRGMLGASSL